MPIDNRSPVEDRQRKVMKMNLVCRNNKLSPSNTSLFDPPARLLKQKVKFPELINDIYMDRSRGHFFRKREVI